MDIFLLNTKDIDSKTILLNKLWNMYVALHNMHIVQVYIAATILPHCTNFARICAEYPLSPNLEFRQFYQKR
jgi:hypothetical protein